jgi:4-hydroxy-4-methyl-2-oxoglutarate aldolase
MSISDSKDAGVSLSAKENGKSTAPDGLLAAIRRFDTCTVANAIERFGVRLRNEGFTRPGLQCLTSDSSRLIGYAATFKIRSADPPMVGTAYFDRTDWWAEIERLPVPRVAVFEDLEADSSSGSTVGEVHAAILKAFRCDGVITNGSVRDIPAIRGMEFPVFARTLAVSHAYTHIVGYGSPVRIYGLEIRQGDLVYGDCHGVVSIPIQIVADLPRVAGEIRAGEQRIIDLCQAPGFSPEKLLAAIRNNP